LPRNRGIPSIYPGLAPAVDSPDATSENECELAIVGRVQAASLVGRDEPLERLRSFVRSIAEGPAGVVVAGEAGIGKSTLWHAALDDARGCDYRVLVSVRRLMH